MLNCTVIQCSFDVLSRYLFVCRIRNENTENTEAKPFVVRIPLFDGQPSPLHVTDEFVKDALSWLQGDPCNVVAVHCKAGKGRTGTLICSLLTHLALLHPHLLPSSFIDPAHSLGSLKPSDVMQSCFRHYDSSRTHNGRGLTIPSQKRSVALYTQQNSLHDQMGIDPKTGSPFKLLDLTIRRLPSHINDVTIALWQRPAGCYGHRMLSLVHCWRGRQVSTNGRFSTNASMDQKSLEWVEKRWGTWPAADPTSDCIKATVVEAHSSLNADQKGQEHEIRLSFESRFISGGGDIKLQVFKGYLLDDLRDGRTVFNHPRSVFYAWFNLGGSEDLREMALSWRDVDKLKKSLRGELWSKDEPGVIVRVAR